MKATVLEPSACKRTLDIEISAEEVSEERAKVAREYAKAASVPGFRKGKTPAAVIRKRYAKEIEQEVVEKLTKDACWKLIDEHKLTPLQAPAVDEIRSKEGEPLKFRASFEIHPTITLGNYKGLETVRRRLEVTDKMVDSNLQSLRESNARLEPVEGRALEAGDIAEMDLRSLDADGKLLGELREGVQVDLGEGGAPEELRDQLVGLKAGEKRVVTTGGEEENKKEESAAAGEGTAAAEGAVDQEGAAAPEAPRPLQRYEVSLKAIRQKVFPDLDDEFAKDQGEFENLDALKARIREDLQRRADQQADDEVTEQLLGQLVQAHDFPAPETLVENELGRMLHRIAEAMGQSGVDPSQSGIDWDKKREELRDHAEKRTRADMLLDEIALAEKLDMTDEEMLAALAGEAERQKTSATALHARLKKDGRLEVLKTKMLRQKSLDLVERSANIMNKAIEP